MHLARDVPRCEDLDHCASPLTLFQLLFLRHLARTKNSSQTITSHQFNGLTINSFIAVSLKKKNFCESQALQ